MFLQDAFDGSELQTILAFTHAFLRVRHVLLKGTQFHSYGDLQQHILGLVQHPWLDGDQDDTHKFLHVWPGVKRQHHRERLGHEEQVRLRGHERQY